MTMADRDGLIWYDGKLVPWREAKTHVLTHTLPERSLQARLRKMPSVFMDDCQVRKMLDDLANHMSYKAWFAGHLHENYMDVENRCYWLFDRIVSISPENMVSILPVKKHLPK